MDIGSKKPKKIKQFVVITTDNDGKHVEKEYLLVEPTAKIIREARYEYSIAFSNALKDGLLTERQMSYILESNRENDDVQSARLAALYIQAATLEDRISKAADGREKTKIAEELRVIRGEVVREEQAIRAPYYNTAEQKSEEIRGEYMMRHMVRYNDNAFTPVWKTEEDYEGETDSVLMETARTYFFYWLYNLDEKWEEKLPENLAIASAVEAMGKEDQEYQEQSEPEVKKKSRGRTAKAKVAE